MLTKTEYEFLLPHKNSAHNLHCGVCPLKDRTCGEVPALTCTEEVKRMIDLYEEDLGGYKLYQVLKAIRDEKEVFFINANFTFTNYFPKTLWMGQGDWWVSTKIDQKLPISRLCFSMREAQLELARQHRLAAEALEKAAENNMENRQENLESE